MAKPKLDLRHLIIEALLIVFTVSLALALSEWRSQVKKENLVERVLTSLESESKKNVDSLKKAISYHDELLTNLRNGTHVMISASLDQVPFDPLNDKALVSFVKSQTYANTSLFKEPIEIINNNGNRYLRVEDRLSLIKTKNDSLFIYGKSQIILRSASISNNSWQIAQATNALIELDYDLISTLGLIASQFEEYESTVEMAVNILYSSSGDVQSALEDIYSIEKKLLTQYEAVLEML